MNTLNKKSILQKTAQVGGSTLISRILGLIREAFLAHYLPLGAISDAFFSAYKIPNSLRKIFAEGALSAVFIPTIVGLEKSGDRKAVNSLMSLSFLVFEGFLLLLCLLIFAKADFVVWLTTPGFSAEQVEFTEPLLRILIFFILFLSSSSLMAGALQSVHHFWIPAFGPVLLNVVFIAGIALGIWFNLPVTFLCLVIVFGGFLQFVLHLYMYLKLNFSFDKIDANSVKNLKGLLKRFLPVLFSTSIMEIILFVDEGLASYLPAGSISLIYYANRFMGIPLGVFATAFSTILLPHFSRISTYAPSRLSFYLLESTKLIFWVTVPVTILMSFFADKIFITLFLSDKFPMSRVPEAKYILIAFVTGLFFFSINKILVNVYYALKDTFVPMVVSVTVTVVNLILNFILMRYFQATGLAVAMTVSLGLLQTILLSLILFRKHKLTIYPKYFMNFLFRFAIQLVITMIGFFIAYNTLNYLIANNFSVSVANFFTNKIGFWLWVGPLSLLMFYLLYRFKKLFGVQLYFLD